MNEHPFKFLDLRSPNLQKDVVSIITDFMQKTTLPQNELTIMELLGDLFSHFKFDLKQFCLSNNLTELEGDAYLSYLLYGIYYNEIPLVREHLTPYYFYTLLAETLSEQRLRTIILNLDTKQQLALLAFCHLHLREGAWLILQQFKNVPWHAFIQLLTSKYYSAQYLDDLLRLYPEEEELVFFQNALDLHARDQLDMIHKLLSPLISQIVSSPLRGFEAIEKLKHNANADADKLKQKVLQSQASLENLFALHIKEHYSVEELKAFFQIFGLEGQYLKCPGIENPQAPLSIRLKQILDLFENPSLIPLSELDSLIYFILNICNQLYAFLRNKILYEKGLNKLVFAVPTLGLREKMPWITSVLEGLREVHSHIGNERAIGNHAIILFDQSSTGLLKKNRAFTREQAKRYRATIWHLSKTQTIRLAKKIGVDQWIITDRNDSFGYGGSRNCVFFLAPLIQKAYSSGVKTFAALMKLPLMTIKKLYNSAVMGVGHQDLIIQMGEDDIYIPACNFFVDALYSEQHKNDYFNKPSFCIGRSTHIINPVLDLETINKTPPALYDTTYWRNVPFLGGLKGMLTKPRFCFPLPYGNEECHVILPHYSIDFFHQPIIHLGGTRFPSKLFPCSPLDGVIEYLQRFLPYCFHISLCNSLIDAENQRHRCIVPWNEPSFRKSSKLHCLQDLIDFADSPETRKHLAEGFWKNMEVIFNKPDRIDLPLCVSLHNYIQAEIPSKTPADLKAYYENLRNDANFLLQLGQGFLKHHRTNTSKNWMRNAISETEKLMNTKLSDNPLSIGLYNLVRFFEELHT